MKPSSILYEAHERGDRQVRRMGADTAGGMCAFRKIMSHPDLDRTGFGAEAKLDAATCPLCTTQHTYVNEMVVHLNDWHEFNFKSIGDWLAGLGL